MDIKRDIYHWNWKIMKQVTKLENIYVKTMELRTYLSKLIKLDPIK